MATKDRKIYWNEKAYDVVSELLGMLEERNLVAADLNLRIPNDMEAESVFKGPGIDGETEWFVHACSDSMEGDIRVASLSDDILLIWIKDLETYLGIVMSEQQKLIAKMYDYLFPMFMEEHELVKLPSDEISYIDDIDKVFNGECDDGDCASETYGNGDYGVMELYKIRADFQLFVIEECFDGFIKKAKNIAG